MVSMEIVNGYQRAEAVGFRVLAQTVEVTYQDSLVATFDRQDLRRWLNKPGDRLVAGDLAFVDTSDCIALVLPGVEAWALAPIFLELLRRRV